jgi:hypothetical protein
MADSNTPAPSREEAIACPQGSREPLTGAQCDFAKLLGRLLAQRWIEEQRGKQDASALESEKRN